MKRMTVLLATMLILLTACGQKASTPTWQEQYNLGLRYLSEGNYEEAIIAFTAAIEIDPKQALAYVGRGDAYVGTAQLSATDTQNSEELTEDELLNYQNAVTDYLAAIELDETNPEIYEKAAEVYILLGDTDAAIEILQRGVEATDDERLQEYLDELMDNGPLTVLTYQAAYKPDGTLFEYEYYFYDENGYMIRQEETNINDYDGSSVVMVDNWIYDVSTDSWAYIPDRQRYDTDEEWEDARETLYQMEQGTFDYWVGSYGGDFSVCVDPVMDKTERANVLANEGVLQNEHGDGDWSYAVYTFDEDGLPIAITTYMDGVMSGSAILEWSVIEPATIK